MFETESNAIFEFSTKLKAEPESEMNLHVLPGISNPVHRNGSCGIMGIASPLARLRRAQSTDNGIPPSKMQPLDITHTHTRNSGMPNSIFGA